MRNAFLTHCKAIMAEGKELAMAIGVLTLSTREMYVYINESACLSSSDTLSERNRIKGSASN